MTILATGTYSRERISLVDKNARISQHALAVSKQILDLLCEEGAGPLDQRLQLISPYTGRLAVAPLRYLRGPIDDENRTLLNKVYGLTGARMVETSLYEEFENDIDDTVLRITVVPVGEQSKIEEITSGIVTDEGFDAHGFRAIFSRATL